MFLDLDVNWVSNYHSFPLSGCSLSLWGEISSHPVSECSQCLMDGLADVLDFPLSWVSIPDNGLANVHNGLSNVHGWSCQSSWSSMMFFSSCCFSPRTAAAMSAAGALKIGRTLEIWGYMVVMVARVILMMQFLVKMDSEKYSTLAHLAPITWTP